MTQEQVAAGSGGRLGRLDVVKLENGQNQGSSHRARAGIAAAFCISQEDVAAYLDGKIDLEEVLRRREHTQDEVRVPRGLLHAFVRHPSHDEEALVRVAKAYREEPPQGWAAALDEAHEELQRERPPNRTTPPPGRRKRGRDSSIRQKKTGN